MARKPRHPSTLPVILETALARAFQGKTEGEGPSVHERVGYKSPPRSTRFVKGKSGNPAGRPRKQKDNKVPTPQASVLAQLRQEQTRLMTVREGERVRPMPAVVAHYKLMEKGATEGSVLLKKAVFEAALAAERERRAEIEADHAVWHDYIARFRKCQMETKLSDDDWLSRPEDFIFPEDDFVRLHGPQSKEEAKQFDYLRKFHNACIVKSIYDITTFPHFRKKHPIPPWQKFSSF